MLFEVNVRNTVVPRPDGVTFEDSADGFKSAWVSLPIPLPEARAISLATLCQQNQRPTGNSDGFEPVYTVYQPYRSPTSRGDFEIEVDFSFGLYLLNFRTTGHTADHVQSSEGTTSTGCRCTDMVSLKGSPNTLERTSLSESSCAVTCKYVFSSKGSFINGRYCLYKRALMTWMHK